MKLDLEFFAWARPRQGYAWEDADAALFFEDRGSVDDRRDHDEKRFLRWRDETSQAEMMTPLLDRPTLFREFANLEANEGAFVEFANQHGWLGVPCFLQEKNPDGAGHVVNFGPLRSQGEPLWRWQHAHREMRKVNAVLEAIQAEDVVLLKQWFRVVDDAIRYEHEDALGWSGEWVCSSKPGLKNWLWRWGNEGRDEKERLLRFASGWAQKHINQAMSGKERGTGTSVRVLMNDVKDGMMLHIVPDSLLAAMWLQCSRVLTDNPTFKACEHCGKWFELSPGARRKHSKYCSTRCKVAAHRALIPVTCEHCKAKFKVGINAQAGFGYINHQDVTCPKCEKVSSLLLPGELRDIR